MALRTQGLDIESPTCSDDPYPCPRTSSVFDGEYLNTVSGVHYRRLHVRSPKLPSPLPNGGSFF